MKKTSTYDRDQRLAKQRYVRQYLSEQPAADEAELDAQFIRARDAATAFHSAKPAAARKAVRDLDTAVAQHNAANAHQPVSRPAAMADLGAAMLKMGV